MIQKYCVMRNKCLSDTERFWGQLALGLCCGFGQDWSEAGSQAGARSCWGVNTCQAAPDNSAAQRHFPRLPAEWSIIAVGEGSPLLHAAPRGSHLLAAFCKLSLAGSPLENKCSWIVFTGELVADTSSQCRGTLKYNKQGKLLFP